MPCRKTWVKISWRSSLQGPVAASFAVLAIMTMTLTGCGGQLGSAEPPPSPENTSPPGAKLLATLLGMKQTGSPDSQNAASGQHIFCPEVRFQEGAESSRVYAGTPPSSTNLRYQYELTDTARECTLDGDQLSLKIGVAGKVLLGPAGTAGKFTVPVRMAVFRKSENEPEVTKLYQATVNVGQSEAQAAFTIVSEPLRVSFIQDHSEKDYMIRVGVEEGNATGDKARSSGKH